MYGNKGHTKNLVSSSRTIELIIIIIIILKQELNIFTIQKYLVILV